MIASAEGRGGLELARPLAQFFRPCSQSVGRELLTVGRKAAADQAGEQQAEGGGLGHDAWLGRRWVNVQGACWFGDGRKVCWRGRNSGLNGTRKRSQETLRSC